MKTESKALLLQELSDEYWQLDFDIENGFFSSIKEVLLYAQAAGVAQSRIIHHPEFLMSDEKIFILNTGLVMVKDTIQTIYLHKGIARDLSILIVFEESGSEFRFEFNIADTDNLDILLRCVKSTLSHLPQSPDPYSGLTCPCCLNEQAKIRQTPQLHPLFSVLESMVCSEKKLTLKLTSPELNIYEHYELHLSTALHYNSANVSMPHKKGGVLSVDLSRIYSITMNAKTYQRSDCIQFNLFDSMGNRVAEIMLHNVANFSHWKSLLCGAATV